MERVTPGDGDVRSALIRQWQRIADVATELDPAAPSRIEGWTNKEVLAHLYVQPHLVLRFLRSAGGGRPTLRLTDNLAGTGAFKDLIDSSARQGARLGKFDLGGPLAVARQPILRADLGETIETFQGPISVSDYLVTRCVEAVVHGGDLVDAVAPDAEAESITSKALLDVLSTLAPELVPEAEALPSSHWIDIATGRCTGSGRLVSVTPVMS